MMLEALSYIMQKNYPQDQEVS